MRGVGKWAEAKRDRRQIPRCGRGDLSEGAVPVECQKTGGKRDTPHSAVLKTRVAAEKNSMGNG